MNYWTHYLRVKLKSQL